MPKISFTKQRAPIEVSMGANLMQSLLEAGIPVASSCFGDGVCGKCRLDVTAGMEHLAAAGETERFLIQTKNLTANQRISCQTTVMGDITVDASYW